MLHVVLRVVCDAQCIVVLCSVYCVMQYDVDYLVLIKKVSILSQVYGISYPYLTMFFQSVIIRKLHNLSSISYVTLLDIHISVFTNTHL